MTKKRARQRVPVIEPDWGAVWTVIARELPQIAREVRLQARICANHGRAPTFANLQWAARELARLDE